MKGWVCNLCNAAVAEEYEFCSGCHIGERRVNYDNVRPLKDIDGRNCEQAGCPRHPVADRSCVDSRCQRTWEPAGAPTPEEQLQRWASGESVCPNTKHECCPDFSCCRPHLGWPLDKRSKYVTAEQGEREKMLMGSLGALATDVRKKAYVTRGDPADNG